MIDKDPSLRANVENQQVMQSGVAHRLDFWNGKLARAAGVVTGTAVSLAILPVAAGALVALCGGDFTRTVGNVLGPIALVYGLYALGTICGKAAA